MNSISLGVNNIVNTSIRLLNQQTIKESIKNIAGSATLVFGLVEIYDIYLIVRGRKFSTNASSDSHKWIQIANKVIIVCAKISLVLSAGVSRPGVIIITSLVGCVFSTAQLERVFGSNTIFAVNPWHPRHVISIAAVILALPSVVQSTYKGGHWAYKKIRMHQNASTHNHRVQPWLTDTKIRFMTLFNTITSRPILHIGNQLGRFVFRPV